MKAILKLFLIIIPFISLFCKKDDDIIDPPVAKTFQINKIEIDSASNLFIFKNVNYNPTIKLHCSNQVSINDTLTTNISLKNQIGEAVQLQFSLTDGDSTLIIKCASELQAFAKYFLKINSNIRSIENYPLNSIYNYELTTKIDPTPKFPLISDDALLTTVQRETFKYFWDFGHPTSGLARERNTSGNVCTTGGTGFAIQAIIVAIHRNFISRNEGLQRISAITNFYTNKAHKYHGAFAHWVDGASGATIPFSQYDNGGDLVETSYLMQGLLTAKEYFNSNSPEETQLCNAITQLFNDVEWDWYTRQQNVLYWHWSENYGWQMNHQIQGWNEALITYIMAAASTTHPIDSTVYHHGWAKDGAIKNNNFFYGYQLPLGWDLGGPLFFEHYSFLGINPNGLKDTYADYEIQTKNHTYINYEYCKANPKHFFGYSQNCWGLTASDTYDGYTAHEPNNDLGVISPTAALSSMPYTPTESMNTLKYFYYTLGDKTFKQYGFIDAFSLDRPWFADSFLAIDQGPIIIMIENHRSQLIWNLLTQNSNVKNGLRKLGFTAPYL
ncbi:MAG: beta-glucosidase [Saprospiraceae bacterium]|nr:beta-glucosidase [Saprospiraceae bacterium]